MKTWTVSYTRDGEIGSMVMRHASMPESEHAAVSLRDHLFPAGFIIPDMPPGTREPTIYQLAFYRIRIDSIVEAETDLGSGSA